MNTVTGKLVNANATTLEDVVKFLENTQGYKPNVSVKKIQSVDSVKDQLKSRFQSYRCPSWTKESHSVYIKAGLDMLAREAHVKKLLDPDYFDEDQMLLKRKEWTVSEDNILKGFDFATRQYFPDPLQFDKTVSWDMVSHLVESYPESKTINLVSTLTRLIEWSEDHGLNKRTQFSTVLMMLINNHVPELRESTQPFYSNSNSEEMFVALVESINPEREKRKLIEMKNRIIRAKEEDITIVTNRVRSLCLQIVNVTKAAASYDEKMQIAATMTKNDVPNFITTTCKSKYLAWLSDEQANGNAPTLTECQRKIQDLERDTQLRPKEDMVNKTAEDAALMLQYANAVAGEVSVNYVGSQQRRGQSGERRSSRPGSRSSSQWGGASSGNSQDRSRARTRESSQPRQFGRSRSGSSVPFRSQSQSRPQSRNQSQNRSRPQSLNRGQTRPQSGERFNNESRNGEYRQSQSNPAKSPQSFRKSNSQYIDYRDPRMTPRACFLCASPNHLARNCERYSQPSEFACALCRKFDKKLLFHKTESCRFHSKNDKTGRRSDYRTPSPASRYYNMRNNTNNYAQGKYNFNTGTKN